MVRLESAKGSPIDIYSIWAPVYDLTRVPFRWVTPRVHRAFDQQLLDHGRGAVLDLGAGTGFVASRLAALGVRPKRLTLVDASAPMLRRAKRLASAAESKVCTVEAFFDSGGEEGRYDVVVSSLLLAHVREPEVLIRKVLDLVRPGGTVSLIFFGREGVSPVRWAVRCLLWLLRARPVDTAAVRGVFTEEMATTVRWNLTECSSLGGALVFLSAQSSSPRVENLG